MFITVDAGTKEADPNEVENKLDSVQIQIQRGKDKWGIRTAMILSA